MSKSVPMQAGILATKPLAGDGSFVEPWARFFQAVISDFNALMTITSDTHAKRLAKSPASSGGALFYETDRTVWYVSDGQNWRYLAGTMHSNYEQGPTDLGTNDIGFIWGVSDFAHVYSWIGTEWAFTNGDAGGGYIVAFASGVTPARLTGWHVADGSSQRMLLSNGSSKTVTIPNVAGSYFRQ